MILEAYRTYDDVLEPDSRPLACGHGNWDRREEHERSGAVLKAITRARWRHSRTHQVQQEEPAGHDVVALGVVIVREGAIVTPTKRAGATGRGGEVMMVKGLRRHVNVNVNELELRLGFSNTTRNRSSTGHTSR